MLEFILIDDLGNVKIVEGDAAKALVLGSKTVQRFFTPCQGCDKIVLYDYADLEDENGPFCRKCAEEVR